MSFRPILIVDDNPSNLKLAADVLSFEGLAIEKASSAEEALRSIEEHPPALILMDIGLPGMDGLTLTRMLRGREETRQIGIVALTAFAMGSDEARAILAGCDGYITKPIDTRTFGPLVKRYLIGCQAIGEEDR